MSKKTIFIGNQSNDGTGDSIRDAFDKANQNFDELYSIAGAGSGLYFTKNLVDTPKTLIGDTITNATSIIGINHLGNSLTNKLLHASTGISITSFDHDIYISNTKSSLFTDNSPKLSADLNGNNHKAYGFADPTDAKDLATKQYVDDNAFASSVNLYVSTSGSDNRTGPKAGRALAYAYRTVGKACQVAQSLISNSTTELGPDQKYITYGNNANKASIYNVSASTTIPGNFVLTVYYTGEGTDPWIEGDIRPGQYLVNDNGAVGFIDALSNSGSTGNHYEQYDVKMISATQFVAGDFLKYGTPVATTNITIFVESGTYEEQYPIKVPANTSIRGDEFRRVSIRPAAGKSTSPWVKTHFCRDTTFDGMTTFQGTLTNYVPQRFGYHYLSDPTDINSDPLRNDQIDVFLMNDQTILRAISCQGHGGFMVVLDPEGQILTKSPYIQNCSSISKSINTQTFAGGMYIDGCAGNLETVPDDKTTYFVGTLTVAVSGLTIRQPQVPCAFIINGIRYEVDYYTPNDNFSSAKCSRDTGLIVDSLATDLLFPDNGYTQSNFAGLQYWNQAGYTGAIGNEISTLTNAINYISAIAQLAIQNQPPATAYQSTITQIINLPAAPLDRVSALGSEFSQILAILTTGTANITDQIVDPGQVAIANSQSAYDILQANKDYLVAETIGHLTATYPTFVYDYAKCQRDLGYMIDCVSFDLLYGGNRQAIQAGVYYYSYSTVYPANPGEAALTTEAYTRLRTILPSIVTNSLIAVSAANTFSQNTSLPTASATEGTQLQAMVDLIINIITNGPTVANPEVPIGLRMVTGQYARNAAAILAANRDFIRAEIIAYITKGAGVLHLNPLTYGGVAGVNGVIQLTNTGANYTGIPTVTFSSPSEIGGIVAQATATVVGGSVTQININSPGSGYRTPPTVTFTGGGTVGVGGFVPATLTLTTSSIAKGFIGRLPTTLELGTAGYRSSLAADFTQLNDLGYGIVVTNIAFTELVSVFAYFCHVGFYANNGAQIGSSNGAIKYGDYALIANGADRFEVPIPVRLVNNMITTATVLSSSNFWGLNTVNTTSGTTLYLQNFDFIPTAKSQLEVDHGAAVDSTGKIIGIAQYTIAGASTSSNTSTVLQVDLLTSGGYGGLQAPVPNGTPVSVRGYKSFAFTGIDASTISRPSTALDFVESTSIAYNVLKYDNQGNGVSNAVLGDSFNYIKLSPYATALPQSGATTLHINPVTASIGTGTSISDSQRLFNSVIAGQTDNSKRYIFAWKDRLHTITGYTATSITSATITVTPALSTSMTTATVTLYAGLQGGQPAEIYTRVSILRATGQDFVDVGTGGRETSNIPNDIYGPPRKQKSTANEVNHFNKGRVFVTATDQDGNFKVGDLFEINQGTGVATISAEISLNNVVSLRLGSGDLVTKFDAKDTTMNPADPGTVPTQTALVGYLDRRLGLNVAGGVPSGGKLGSGYLDLSGTQFMAGQLKLNGNEIDMGINLAPTTTGKILNLTTCTNTFDAANLGYVQTIAALKVSKSGDSMSGALILSQDPAYSDSLLQATTRGYVDKVRQLSTLSDVTFTSPADTDLLMLGSTLSISTLTNRPIWNATRQIVNVANSSTSDISITRTNNSINLQLRAGVIVNDDVSATAAIAQTKLSLTAAGVLSSSALVTASNLGVAAFDTTFFSATNGWISLVSPGLGKVLISSPTTGIVAWSDISSVYPTNITGNAGTATKLATARNINGVAFDGSQSITVNTVWGVTNGSYLLSTNVNPFNGSTSTTFSVDATTAATASKIVARDVSGDIYAATFHGALVGNVTGTASGNLSSAGGTLSGNLRVVGTIVATSSITSFGADVAENYHTDAAYTPGTVLMFGGEYEVTQCNEDMSPRIAGVVSTDPGYVMNGDIKADVIATIALTGRVPTLVVGPVTKGDMMVAAGNGRARAEANPKMGSVIGKALENFTGGEGVIEVVVGRL